MKEGIAAIALIDATLEQLEKKQLLDRQEISSIYQSAAGTLEQAHKLQQSPETKDAQKTLRAFFDGHCQR